MKLDLTAGSSTEHPALAKAMAALPEADRQWLEASRAAQLVSAKATAARAKAAAIRNTAEGERIRAGIREALDAMALEELPDGDVSPDPMALYALPGAERHATTTVIDYMMRMGPGHFGLRSIPDPKTIRDEVYAQINKAKGKPTPASRNS